MKYNDVKTPRQLLSYMNEIIRYGFVDEEGKIYGSWNMQEFQECSKTKWHLSSPERLIKVKYGNCFDQVELERVWFKNHNYNFKTFYIWFCLPYNNTYSIHVYLVFEENSEFYYFEYSDVKSRGIKAFNSYEEAVFYQRQKHIENNRERNPVGEEELKHLIIYEYDCPTYGCTMNEFTDYILENGKELKLSVKK